MEYRTFITYHEKYNMDWIAGELLETEPAVKRVGGFRKLWGESELKS